MCRSATPLGSFLAHQSEAMWPREGEEPQESLWDIQKLRVDGEWRLHTVADASLEASD